MSDPTKSTVLFSKHVLLIEDNEDDIVVTQRAFKKADNFTGELHIVTDGKMALDYLYNRNEFKDSNAFPRPNIILLDINIPKITGIELLKKIKADEKLNDIPVVILSSSENEEDINNSYAVGAASYLAKPVSFKRFMEVIHAFNDYWLRNQFPKH